MNGTYRRPLRAAALALLLCTAVRCDSGDIYESHQATTEGVSVRGTFELLNPEVFPGEYDLIFGAFGEGGTSALSSVNVLKPTDGDRVELSIENVPEDARSVRLCMTNSGRQVVYTFFEYALDDDRTSDIDLPSAQIDLREYDRIQRLVFQPVQAASPPSGRERRGEDWLLTEGNSYRSLVGTASTLSDKLRVKPSDPEGSFLLDVLTSQEAISSPPHTGFVTRSEDIDLLRIWIEKGCPQN